MADNQKDQPTPDESGTATAKPKRSTKKAPQKKPPQPLPPWKVLLHNDNYTTRDFVVAVLKEVFHKSESDAVQIMLHVHYNGIGVAGVYPYEVAETKIRLTEKLARENEFPLRLSMEPED